MLKRAGNVIVAIDHAPLGLLEGLDDIELRAEQILDGQPDGLIANYGLLKHLGSMLEVVPTTAIARLDGNRTYLAGDWTASSEWELFYDADACAKVGAGAAIVNLLLGGPAELASLNVVARAAVACHAADIPLLVSAIYLGSSAQRRSSDRAEEHSSSLAEQPTSAADHEGGACFAARMAFELGADYVIAYGTTAPDRLLPQIRQWCPTPILAQGAPTNSPADLVAWARDCVRNGACGLVAGQAVWRSSEPKTTVTDLRRAVQEAEPASLAREEVPSEN